MNVTDLLELWNVNRYHRSARGGNFVVPNCRLCRDRRARPRVTENKNGVLSHGSCPGPRPTYSTWRNMRVSQ